MIKSCEKWRFTIYDIHRGCEKNLMGEEIGGGKLDDKKRRAEKFPQNDYCGWRLSSDTNLGPENAEKPFHETTCDTGLVKSSVRPVDTIMARVTGETGVPSVQDHTTSHKTFSQAAGLIRRNTERSWAWKRKEFGLVRGVLTPAFAPHTAATQAHSFWKLCERRKEQRPLVRWALPVAQPWRPLPSFCLYFYAFAPFRRVTQSSFHHPQTVRQHHLSYTHGGRG